jgi:hypothetical protein
VTRYLVFVIPIGLLIAVPIVVGATVDSAKGAKIGGVRILWFFTWIEAVWLSIWASKVIAKALPAVFIFLCGVVSSGTWKSPYPSSYGLLSHWSHLQLCQAHHLLVTMILYRMVGLTL